MKPRWNSPVPEVCETCGGKIIGLFVDGKTKMGPWACMCFSCFMLGPGLGKLGCGLGQMYEKKGDVFYLTKGSCNEN